MRKLLVDGRVDGTARLRQAGIDAWGKACVRDSMLTDWPGHADGTALQS
ncbi:hypothetical protein KVP09_09960 [Alcaligenaceae bacterium CGII-47]|nr:hypothetical protein [Alcaligenaceae bacterium CGII-47]